MIIRIKNLKLESFVGVYDWEKKHKRTLVFNVAIEVDDEASAKSDKISDTVDYDKIIAKIKDYVANNYCHLIEKMAGDILDLIMQDQRIKECSLEVDKLQVYDFLDSFSVQKTAKRK